LIYGIPTTINFQRIPKREKKPTIVVLSYQKKKKNKKKNKRENNTEKEDSETDVCNTLGNKVKGVSVTEIIYIFCMFFLFFKKIKRYIYFLKININSFTRIKKYVNIKIIFLKKNKNKIYNIHLNILYS
jgi:hypothetical protein